MYCVCLSVGNYSIPIADGNVGGADTLEGAGILNCLNIYIKQTTVNTHCPADNSRFWCRGSAVVH